MCEPGDPDPVDELLDSLPSNLRERVLEYINGPPAIPTERELFAKLSKSTLDIIAEHEVHMAHIAAIAERINRRAEQR